MVGVCECIVLGVCECIAVVLCGIYVVVVNAFGVEVGAGGLNVFVENPRLADDGGCVK